MDIKQALKAVVASLSMPSTPLCLSLPTIAMDNFSTRLVSYNTVNIKLILFNYSCWVPKLRQFTEKDNPRRAEKSVIQLKLLGQPLLITLDNSYLES